MSTLKVTNIENPDGGGVSAKIADVGGGQLSNRNLIINGAMRVAQRGTSVTGVTAAGYHSVDRFKAEISAMGTYTISQSTDAPDGFGNSLKYEVTTADASPAASDQVALAYLFEGQDLQHLNYGSSSAKSLTLSFWVKSDVTGTYSNELMQPDNSNKHYSFSYTINTADTWEHKTVTIGGDASGVIANDTGNGLLIKWYLGAGSNFTSGTYSTGSWKARTVANTVSSSSPNFASTVGNEWYITGVQLEVGSVATTFEHRILTDELIKCQRYFEKSYDISVAPGTAASSGALQWQSNGSGSAIASFPAGFTVRKRDTPTIVIYNADNGASGSLRCQNGTNQAAQAYNTGQTGFNFRTTLAATTDQRYLGHYTAEAEL